MGRPVALIGRDLVTIDDLTNEEVEDILALAHRLDPDRQRVKTRGLLADQIIATLFFEPSTRTRLSFEAAAHRLGAQVIGFADATATSAKKGESLEDSVRTTSGYSDLIVLRHPEPGSARRAADASEVPVVNAGDGSQNHPTQALLDLYTIEKERGRLSDHNVVLLGDLRHGRTVHSLAVLLARFGNRLTFVAPEGLEMPRTVVAACEKHGPAPRQSDDLESAMGDADVFYVTRLQEERFPDTQQHRLFAGSYTVTPQVLAQARDDLTILHPLPRVGEIPTEVDVHPGAAYFRQAQNGVPVRMALLTRLLTETSP